MKDKNVSLIVSCYNRDDIVEKCINHLLELEYKYGDFEIIAVNDGSTDNTGNILEKYKKDIILIHHLENRGLAAARNSGIKQAKYDLLVFLDCDMVVDRNWLNVFVEEISKDDNIIGVFGNNQYPFDLSKASKYTKYLYSKNRGARKFGEGVPIYYKYFLFNNTIIKKIAFEKAGYFDESIGYYGEDTDMSLRIWKYFPDGFRFSFRAYSLHYHFRELDDMEKTMYFYGYNKLPLLGKKHPEFKKDFGITLADSFYGGFLFNIFFINLSKIFLKIVPYPVSNFFIKFVMSASAFRGYRKAKKK